MKKANKITKIIKENSWIVKSKGMIAGIGLIIYAILEFIESGIIDIEKILVGLGLIGIRHAIHKSNEKK